VSFLDTLKDPVKAAKDGWDSLTHTVSNGADIAGDLLLSPVRAGRDLTAKVVSTVTNIDETKIKDTLNLVGTTLTSPMQALTSAIGLTGETSSVVKNISTLALLTSPTGLATLTMTKVADGHWLSGDKKISVQQVDSFKDQKAADQLGGAWALYDKQNAGNKDVAERAGSKESKPNAPQVLDFSPEIYINTAKPEAARVADKAAERATDTTREYTNANGEKATVTANNGEIHYTSTKDGKTVTDASQTAERSQITHNGVAAELDTKLGRLSLSTEQVHVLQQNGRAEVSLEGKGKIIKDADGKITLVDVAGVVLQTIEAGRLNIGRDNDLHVYGANQNLIDKVAESKQQGAPEQPAVNVFMTTAGDLLAELADGTTLQRRKDDGNVMIRLSSGKVVLIESESARALILRDGKFEPLVAGTEEAEKAQAALKAGGVEVSGHRVEFQGGALDLINRTMTWKNQHNRRRHIDLSQTAPVAAESKVTVETENQTVVTEGTNKVQTTDTQGNKYETDVAKGDVRTPDVYVAPAEIRVKQNDGQDVIISKDNEVAFDGGKGPKLHKDGGMKLDEQTETDREGHVRSGSWHGSYSGDVACVTRAGLETAATNVSLNARNNANHVYAKALSGKVTFGDISALNGELGSVSAMMNQLAAAGCGDLIAQLQNSCAAIIETINFATPKALAFQVASDRGLSLAA
jgi:hypothetical protein